LVGVPTRFLPRASLAKNPGSLDHQSIVRGRESQGTKFIGPDPAMRRHLTVPGLTGQAGATERMKANPAVFVLMLDRRQRPFHRDDDPEFFGHFPLQAIRGGFARLNLAARQFPEAAQDRILPATANKQALPLPGTVVDE